MKMPIDEALKTGKIVEGTICYTGDITSPKETKYTLDYYVNMALELESLGCHSIAIKDMAALLKPRAAKELVTALKKELHVPLHLHTHDSHRKWCEHCSDGRRGRCRYRGSGH